MADGMRSSERQTLGQFAKSQTKYGTASIPVRWNSNFVKHKVVSTDSLVGIALKYGVSVSGILFTFLFKRTSGLVLDSGRCDEEGSKKMNEEAEYKRYIGIVSLDGSVSRSLTVLYFCSIVVVTTAVGGEKSVDG
uniref:Uncharacterized protein n=1 Tax=Octopus bimaculoides TaxID=37653 RepID=A0A0L8GZ25_OCTBM